MNILILRRWFLNILRINILRSWKPFEIWIWSAENLLEKQLFGQKKEKEKFNECCGGGTSRSVLIYVGSENAKGEANKQILRHHSHNWNLVTYPRRCVPSQGDLMKFIIATLFFSALPADPFVNVPWAAPYAGGCQGLLKSGRAKIYIWSQKDSHQWQCHGY